MIAIRNKHHIDSSTFFAHFSSSQEKRDFMKEIGDAYEKKDKQKLLTIKRDIDQLPNSRQKKYYQLQIDLVLNVYLTKAADIPDELKNATVIFVSHQLHQENKGLFNQIIKI